MTLITYRGRAVAIASPQRFWLAPHIDRLPDRLVGREAKNCSHPPTAVMNLQPITYPGRTVAACTRNRFLLADELVRRPPGDRELTFVLFMCAYASDVLRGDLPGPYTDENARRYARAALIPTELLERHGLDVHRAAAALSVPADELEAAQLEHPRRRAVRPVRGVA